MIDRDLLSLTKKVSRDLSHVALDEPRRWLESLPFTFHSQIQTETNDKSKPQVFTSKSASYQQLLRSKIKLSLCSATMKLSTNNAIALSLAAVLSTTEGATNSLRGGGGSSSQLSSRSLRVDNTRSIVYPDFRFVPWCTLDAKGRFQAETLSCKPHLRHLQRPHLYATRQCSLSIFSLPFLTLQGPVTAGTFLELERMTKSRSSQSWKRARRTMTQQLTP